MRLPTQPSDMPDTMWVVLVDLLQQKGEPDDDKLNYLFTLHQCPLAPLPSSSRTQMLEVIHDPLQWWDDKSNTMGAFAQYIWQSTHHTPLSLNLNKTIHTMHRHLCQRGDPLTLVTPQTHNMLTNISKSSLLYERFGWISSLYNNYSTIHDTLCKESCPLTHTIHTMTVQTIITHILFLLSIIPSFQNNVPIIVSYYVLVLLEELQQKNQSGIAQNLLVILCRTIGHTHPQIQRICSTLSPPPATST